MRRSRALVGGLALACLAAPGCGTASKEEIKPRDPSGQGLTRGSDVSVENVDELRAIEVVVNRDRFQPQQVSIGTDSTVRITNGDEKTVRIRALRGLDREPIEDPVLEPGEFAEIDFLDAGVEQIELKGTQTRPLEINVFPPG